MESEQLSGRPVGLTLKHEISLVLLIDSAQILTQAAFGQVIAPLHIIGEGLGAKTSDDLSWYAAGYSLTVGTFILTTGRLGDLYGYKKLWCCGYAWFGFWSLLAGLSAFSRSSIFFDVCRAMQGIGPALLMPNGLAILGSIYPVGPRKDMAFASFGACSPLGFLVGAVFASLFAEFVWWPWAFWTLSMVCAVLTVLSFVLIPSIEHHGSETGGDWLGSAVGISGLVLFNFAWNQAAVVGWSEPYVGVLLIVGLVLFVAFGVIESRVSHPLIPRDTFSGKGILPVLGCIIAGWSAFGIWVLYMWNFLELLRGLPPLVICAQFAPIALTGLLASVATGFLISRIRTEWIMLFSLVAFFIPTVLAATMPVDQTYWSHVFASVIIMPFGMDMSFPSGTHTHVKSYAQGAPGNRSVVDYYNCEL